MLLRFAVSVGWAVLVRAVEVTPGVGVVEVQADSEATAASATVAAENPCDRIPALCLRRTGPRRINDSSCYRTSGTPIGTYGRLGPT